MSKQLQNKILQTSIDRNQLPQNLNNYQCDLIIEQNIQTSKTKKYLIFRHKQNKQPSFRISLNSFKRPSNLMHVYKLENDKLLLKGKIQRIGQSRVIKQQKTFKYKQVGSDDEDEYVQKILVFEEREQQQDYEDESVDSQSSSIGMAPTSQESKSKVKNAIIEILNKRERVSSITELNGLLKREYKIKIPQSSCKQIASKVCINEKKSKGYSLRSQYLDDEEMMIQGSKKMKYND